MNGHSLSALPGIQRTFALTVTDKHEAMANVKASRLAFIHPAMVLTQIFKPISLKKGKILITGCLF